MAENTERLRAADLITAIKSAGIRFIVALPDRTTSEHLLKPMLADPDLRVVQICKELVEHVCSEVSGEIQGNCYQPILNAFTLPRSCLADSAPSLQTLPRVTVHTSHSHDRAYPVHVDMPRENVENASHLSLYMEQWKRLGAERNTSQ